jgi:hypothetical protein
MDKTTGLSWNKANTPAAVAAPNLGDVSLQPRLELLMHAHCTEDSM